MSTLYAVALLICIKDQCRAEVLTNEVYKGQEDCSNRARHLESINPGKEFICATVKREAP